ncbi:MAG TPA: 3-hydroxyacyl-CoA dehydrogenase/enoyl-CoA hydratase family protein [Vicinamibacteria bacterium]|nr:3-hydroxyacyl-CoA dehydrogenase/enoyl-CoA hydratase family protein [Vicinamibacteria bacterium]
MGQPPIRNVVVLGAGTMGAQVAAHLAGCGLSVSLLDLVPADAGSDRNRLAVRALEGLRRLKPSPLHLPEDARAVTPGNFEDDGARLRAADWILEAVVEDLEIKRALFARLAPAMSPRAVVTTNTSGLGIAAMAAGLPASLRPRFLGTHFFNPPRYLKLLETIPGGETDPAVLAAMEAFLETVVGKAVVRCKDTPNFIANRIGSYGFGAALRAMQDLDLGIDDVDALTGPAIGRAKSATFRTADIAGVDVCLKVAENLHRAVPRDPERDVFAPPEFMKAMVARGWLGEKAGGGFYRKEGAEIRALDWKTLEYRERRQAPFPSLTAAQAVSDPAARLRQVVAGSDPGARFLWRVLSSTALYAASVVPEIADEVVSIDRAMEWGYGWGAGPFRTLDMLGPAAVAERAKSEGRAVPPLLEALLASGRKRFYEMEDGAETAYGPGGARPVPERSGVIALGPLKQRGAVRKKNPGASLVDLGDGVGLVEFHSKMNALGTDAFSMLATAVKEGRAHFDALVVGNQGEQFTVGANLMMVLLAVQEEEWDELDRSIRSFQAANLALKYADLPVVAAPFGLTLGGGCEIALHAARVRASAETYMGLVEVGVGLVPAGGGTKEMALRALDRCAGVDGVEAFPFVKRAFETIAFARVSASGAEALRLFLTPADSLSPNPDRLLQDAKQVALGLARAGWRPGRMRSDVPALGRPALATFKMGIHNALRGGQVSEHDALVATKVATILCGGDRAPGTTGEQAFLDLEREAFLSLLGTKKTQERIQHMLKEGKPLRN